MLTIYGVYRSRATRCLWLAEELGLNFKHIPVIQARRVDNPLAIDAPLNTLSPDYKAINPMGTIPCIKDGDMVLYESMAINLYLARKYGGTLAPKDLTEDAIMMQWSFFAATEIETNALKISLAITDGIDKTEAGKAIIDVAARILKRPLKVLADHLANHNYLVGDRFTVADLNAAEIIRYAQGYKPLLAEFPTVRDWLVRCQERDAFKIIWERRLKEPA